MADTQSYHRLEIRRSIISDARNVFCFDASPNRQCPTKVWSKLGRFWGLNKNVKVSCRERACVSAMRHRLWTSDHNCDHCKGCLTEDVQNSHISIICDLSTPLTAPPLTTDLYQIAENFTCVTFRNSDECKSSKRLTIHLFMFRICVFNEPTHLHKRSISYTSNKLPSPMARR